MKILVIGGTGFVGPYVVRQLIAAGHHVAVFHRGQTKADLPSEIETLLGARNCLPSFLTELGRFGPDVVLDMIPMSEQDAVTATATFEGIAGRIVAISSADVYRSYELLRGGKAWFAGPKLLTEDSPLREKLFPYRARKDSDDPHYRYEKILVERAFMNNPQLPATILRLPAVYGPGDRQHRLFPYLKRMHDDRPAILLESGQEQWRWTRGYVENVAAAISLVVGDKRAAGRIYNVGERTALTEKDWISSIANEVGWRGDVISVNPLLLPEKMRSGMAWQHDLATDTSRIRSELGFSEPVGFSVGLAHTIEWETANPPPEIWPDDSVYQAEDDVLAVLRG